MRIHLLHHHPSSSRAFALALLCVSFSAQADEKTAEETSPFTADSSLSYSRSTAHPDTSDFHESISVGLGAQYAVFEEMSLEVSTNVQRELGLPEEKWTGDNLKFKLAKTLSKVEERDQILLQRHKVVVSASAVAPTNDEDRSYTYYRGSLGSGISWSPSLSDTKWFQALGLTFSSGLNRNFFAYDANRAGNLNNLWVFSLGFDASLPLSSRFTANGGLSNTRKWTSLGGSGDDRYDFSVGVDYSATDQLKIGISEVTSDRTFAYDRASSNLALYDAKLTSVVLTVGYHL